MTRSSTLSLPPVDPQFQAEIDRLRRIEDAARAYAESQIQRHWPEADTRFEREEMEDALLAALGMGRE